MYIDTHCHISREDYDDINLLITENKENGIYKMIVSGCTKDSINESLEIANKYENIYLTIGYHPSEASKVSDNDILELKKVVLQNKLVVGIGEIGLDYHYGSENSLAQKKLFKSQLEIAKELNLPVVIHSRDATKDTIDILKEYPTVKGVIHCFSGSIETANIYVNMNYKIGIGGVITFKNSNLFKVVENIGLSNIVLETDSPYLTPVPFRGKINSSKYIPYIAKKVAEILNLPIEIVEQTTTSNAISLFDLK